MASVTDTAGQTHTLAGLTRMVTNQPAPAGGNPRGRRTGPGPGEHALRLRRLCRRAAGRGCALPLPALTTRCADQPPWAWVRSASLLGVTRSSLAAEGDGCARLGRTTVVDAAGGRQVPGEGGLSAPHGQGRVYKRRGNDGCAGPGRRRRCRLHRPPQSPWPDDAFTGTLPMSSGHGEDAHRSAPRPLRHAGTFRLPLRPGHGPAAPPHAGDLCPHRSKAIHVNISARQDGVPPGCPRETHVHAHRPRRAAAAGAQAQAWPRWDDAVFSVLTGTPGPHPRNPRNPRNYRSNRGLRPALGAERSYFTVDGRMLQPVYGMYPWSPDAQPGTGSDNPASETPTASVAEAARSSKGPLFARTAQRSPALRDAFEKGP